MVRTLLLLTTIMLGWINMPAQAFLSPSGQNLWPILSQQFKISGGIKNVKNYDVQAQIDSDLRHPKYIHRLTENAKPYLFYVFQETRRLHLPAELALLPMIESDYIPYGDSRAGAVGLWQLMPNTANDYGVKMNYFYDGRRSTTVSTKVALTFLSYLYQEFNHNWLLALAAYNAGPGTVLEAIKYNEAHGKSTNFWALPLPRETEAYIPKLLALAAIIQHPHTYGIRLAPIPDKAVTSTVTIKKQMKLKTIATLAHTSVTTVKKLNPALRRQVTPPHQIVTLVLPANKKTEFVKHLAAHKKAMQKKITKQLAKKNSPHHATHHATLAKKIVHPLFSKTAKKNIHRNEHTYIVKRGDNLHRLAAEFDTTTYHIMQHNHLRTATLSIGQHLKLPNA